MVDDMHHRLVAVQFLGPATPSDGDGAYPSTDVNTILGTGVARGDCTGECCRVTCLRGVGDTVDCKGDWSVDEVATGEEAVSGREGVQGSRGWDEVIPWYLFHRENVETLLFD